MVRKNNDIEEAVAEKRGMKTQDEGPIPAEFSEDVYKKDMVYPNKVLNKPVENKLFTVKGSGGIRQFVKKGTHFDVEEGIVYLYDGEEIIGVFGLTNYTLEVGEAPSEV